MIHNKKRNQEVTTTILTNYLLKFDVISFNLRVSFNNAE